MIYYEDFVKLAKKYSLHIYNKDCYLSCNILWNDELMIMTYNCKELKIKYKKESIEKDFK